MKTLLLASLLLIPGLLAAEPQRPPRNDSPEVVAQLNKDAAALELQIKVSPNADLYMKLGFTYARLHQADNALRAFETAVSLDPSKADAYYMLGLIYEKKGLKDQALTAWKTCLEKTAEPQMRTTAIRHIHHLTADK